MDELIIRVLGGAASPAETERVTRWRAAAPENEAAFRRTERLWSLTAPPEQPGAIPPAPPARSIVEAAEAEEAAEASGAEGTPGREDGAQVVAFPVEPPRPRARLRPLRWAVALAAGLAAVSFGIRATGGPDGGRGPIATWEAAAGAARTVVLGDGSVVLLAGGSRLEEWDRPFAREVALEGRAFFAAAHDPDRPLTVRTGVGETRVLGTRFEVAEGDGVLRVVVVEGSVAVSNGAGAVEVPAGSVAQARAGAAPVAAEVEDVFALLDWPQGLLLFHATPLAQVADEVSRHFGRAIEVRGAELRALRITARFEDPGFEDVVLALCDVSGAECLFTETGAIVRPDG